MMNPRELATRLQTAFLDCGYENINMTGIARSLDVTRRTLYNYFSSKEDAFRFAVETLNGEAIEQGMEAGRQAMVEGKDAVDVLAIVLDVRYGNTRRKLMRSPHAAEVNDQAFRRCRDLMIAAAIESQRQLAGLLDEMADAGMFALKSGMTSDDLAQIISDGGRGTNQTLPPVAPENLVQRYRNMVQALLYGATVAPAPQSTRET